MPDNVTLIDRDGRSYGVAPHEVEGYLAQGFRPESDEESSARVATDVRHDEYGGVAGGAVAAGAGLLRGATLGGSDAVIGALGGDRALRSLQEENPYISTGSSILGAVAPAILSGGASTAESGAGIGARILNAAPSSVASRIGAATTGAAGELAGASTIGKIAAHGVGLATEGALYGGGDYLSQVALEDKPLSAEGFVGAMGKGALFAVPVGGAFAIGGKALQRARSLFPRSEVTAQAARAVDKEATSALTQAMSDGEQMAQAAERKLSDVDANVGMAQSGEAVTRRMFGAADPAAMGDQVTGAVDRTQIAKALEDYQASKTQLADWIATEGDPELEAALRGLQGPGVQAPTGEGVPVGEFGAPGAHGYDPGNVREPGPPSQAPLVADPQGTPVTRAIRKGTAPGEPTTAFDFKDSGLTFDPETRNYASAEPKAAEPAAGSPVISADAVDRHQSSMRAALESMTDTDTALPKLGIDAQQRVRAEMASIAKEYGLHYRLADADYSDSILIAHPGETNPKLTFKHEGMPAQAYSKGTDFTGMVMISPAQARLLAEHASLDSSGLRALGKAAVSGDAKADEMVFASHVMNHENVHGFGPSIEHDAHRSAIEELTTELAARRITADAHGVPSSVMGTYSQIIDPIVDGVAKATGTTRTQAYDALEAASLKFKGRSGEISSDQAIHDVASDALAKLGKSDAAAVGAVKQNIYKVSREIGTAPIHDRPIPHSATSRTATPATDTLTGLLRGTQEGLAAGKSLSELGAPARAEYAAAKAARTGEAAAHFRAKATGGVPDQQYRPIRDEDYLSHRKAFESKLTTEESKAIDVYTSSTYKDVNRALRNGEIRNGREKFISQIDSAVAKAPLRENATLYRGLSGDEAKQFRNLEAGDSFEEKAFTSTSSSPDAFKRDVNLHIDVPAGYEAAPVPSSIDEKEWLLRRNTKFVVTGIKDEGTTRSIHVRVVDSPPPRPVGEMVSTKTGRQPDAPPLQVVKSEHTTGTKPIAEDFNVKHPHLGDVDLHLSARTTSESGRPMTTVEVTRRTSYGEDAPVATAEFSHRDGSLYPEHVVVDQPFQRLGVGTRAYQAAEKSAGMPVAASADQTTEGAAFSKKFRAKASAAGDGSSDLMAALQGTKQGLDSGKGLREISGHATSASTAAPAGDLTGVRGLRDAIAKLHNPEAMPVNAAEYDARKAAMGAADRPFSAAIKNHTVGKTIVDSSMRDSMARVSDDDAIARLLGKRVGKDVNMGPSLARAAKAIGDHEAALAGLSDVLGADAPQTVVENAKAYRAAVREQHELNAASSAKAAADIKSKVQPGLDATTVDDKVTQALRQHDARLAAKAPASAATSATAPTGGIGSKLTTAGAALEVLHALGAHVPSVASIPIIGPILSLFLKAKAVMGIIGRKGGSIGQTAESLIAGKAAITRDRVNAAVGQLLDAGAKGARKASLFAVPAAAMLGPKLFPGGEEPKGKDLASLYHARMDEIARAQAPGAIDAAIGDRIQTGDPALHDAVVAQVQKGIAFLDSRAPKQTVMPGVLPGDGTWKPSRAALEEFAKYVHAVNDPASVLEDLAHGHVTMEGAETLKVVYPKLYAEAQRALIERAPEMQATLPYARRVAISIMFGIPVDTTMSASHMTFLQTPTGPGSMGHSVPATPTPSQPAIIGPLQLGQQTMTSLDRRAGA